MQFYYVIAEPKVHKNILKKILNAIVFKIQAIDSTVITSKSLLLSYAMSYGSAILQ